MAARKRRWIVPTVVAVVLAGGLVFAFWPQPVPVDLGEAERGPMVVTIDEEGETRVKDVYVVSAPLAGRVRRFPGKVGDIVNAGETVVATIEPTVPTFHDVRTHSELEASLKAAEANRELAKAEVERAEAARDFADAEYKRAKMLAIQSNLSRSALDRARMEARTEAANVETTKAALRVREFQLATARAALLGPDAAKKAMEGELCCFEVRAPVSGTILQVYQESEAVVPAGAKLVEIGNPADLEIVVDLLSTDAVAVSAGDEVVIQRWGGVGDLNGRVRRVEPFGFTKVSALGIEEQRVNVIIDFTDPREKWARLGHGYRVEVRIVRWRGKDILQVPLSTLFRDAGQWALFKVANGGTSGRARRTRVKIGHMNAHTAEVLSGLKAGDRIVLHPSDRVVDGTRVTAREMQ